MARIELRGIAHRYASAAGAARAHAVQPLDLRLNHGGSYALLGPSGCGKTTLLQIISGLLRPTQGSVWIDGADVTAASPQARNIAQVFQFPVVYDTMTVFENLSFPLRSRGLRGAPARARVEQIAELLELGPQLGRRARELSADLRQRISLGRGLVRQDVAALLLDEPLTVIDPHVKWLLRRKLKQIHEELKLTLIYVTHDQVEALTLADEVLVMKDGEILQRGTAQELFERPAHAFVGYFIGSPGMNLLPCTIEGAAAVVAGQRIALDPALCVRASALGAELALGARPECLRVLREAPPRADSALRAVIARVEDLGSFKLARAQLAAHTLAVKLSEEQSIEPGATCWIEFPQRWTTLYASGRAVC